jgi:hypothetical protein
MRTYTLWLVLIAGSLLSCLAKAAELKQVATIGVPGEKLANFDISFIDQATGRYYLADRSNKAIDVFDTKDDTYVCRVGNFVGAVMKNGKVDSGVSGPDGSYDGNWVTTVV